MADNNNISQLGLDIGPYLDALRDAAKAYKDFAKTLSQTMAIRLDPTSLNALSNAFGVQMRQAMQSVKDAQRETVEESMKSAKKITNAFDGAWGFQGFKELPKKLQTVRESAEAELKKLERSTKKTGESLKDSLSKGMKDASGDIKAQLGSVVA